MSEKLFCSMTDIKDDLIEEALDYSPPAKKRNSLLRFGSIAACLCLIAAGAFMLWREGGQTDPEEVSVSTGEAGEETISAEYYFRDCTEDGESTAGESVVSIAQPPYAESRSFSDERERYEMQGIIPLLDTHPVFTCMANYNDGSLYSVVLTWDRRGSMEEYSTLSIIAAYDRVEDTDDCVVIMDEDGNVIEPNVTVTERDGIQIVAEVGLDMEKSLTFQNESGWYRIVGSWNDDYESVVSLLDWVWDHPLDLSLFPIEAGDNYELFAFSEYPDAFSDVLPDFTSFGYELLEGWVTVKNGEPVRFEGHYASDGGTVENVHWCYDIEPDAYDLERCIGSLDEMTQQAISDELSENSSVSFLWDGNAVCIYSDDAQAVWQLIDSIK